MSEKLASQDCRGDECEWKQVSDAIMHEWSQEHSKIPLALAGADFYMEQTPEGKRRAKQIDREYEGAYLLSCKLGEFCAQQCRIKDYVNEHPNKSFGPKVQPLVDLLKSRG